MKVHIFHNWSKWSDPVTKKKKVNTRVNVGDIPVISMAVWEPVSYVLTTRKQKRYCLKCNKFEYSSEEEREYLDNK